MYLRKIHYDKSRLPDFKQFPFSLPLFNQENFTLAFPSPVTIIVGENGSGKSTLLEALAKGCGFHPSGGSRNNVYHAVHTESSLDEHLTFVWNLKMPLGFFLRAETFYNFASDLDVMRNGLCGGSAYESYGGKSLHQQSHGESFLNLFENRIGNGIYIFDEPEAALSPQKQLRFLSLLHQKVKSGKTQFIIATHSPIIMSYPDSTFYNIQDGVINKSHYFNSEHFQLSKDFLFSPESFHKHLFEE